MFVTSFRRSFLYVRRLVRPGLLGGTQRLNHSSLSCNLTADLNVSPGSSNGGLCLKNCGAYNYSQVHGGRSGKEFKDEGEGQDEDEDNLDDTGEENEEDEEEEEHVTDKEELKAQVEDIFKHKRELSSEEWKEAIKLMALEIRAVTDRSCDAITMKRCLRYRNYHLGTSYMQHLEREGRECNLSTLGNYLQLCGEHVDQSGEDRVLEYYHRLMAQSKVLDVRLLKNAITGVSVTREWRLALDLLQRYRKISVVGSDIYSPIVSAAFRTGDHDLGWEIFDIMRVEGQDPEDSVFLEWVRQCDASEAKAEKEAMLLTLLHKLESYATFPSVEVTKTLSRFCSESLGWTAHYVRMPRSGRCPACKQQMEVKDVSEEEYRQLQEEFVPRVLTGSDIFRSTDPEEWQEFQRVVERRRPFSVVVDGLNVSYILGRKSAAARQQALRDVVEQSLAQHPNGSVLVLGRQHMKNWSKNMRWDPERVCVFTLNNLSKDDGFFLYAALQSGIGTKFITSDLLRDHLFRLGARHLQDTFTRWQRTHQVMVISATGRARLLAPAKFSTVTQQHLQNQNQHEPSEHRPKHSSSSSFTSSSSSSWHLPYDDGAPRQNYELPTTWLCLHPSLTLSHPLPYPLLPYVSREPIIHSDTHPHQHPPTTSSPHGSDTAQRFLQRHQDRMFTPMNGLRGSGGGSSSSGGRGGYDTRGDQSSSGRGGGSGRRGVAGSGGGGGDDAVNFKKRDNKIYNSDYNDNDSYYNYRKKQFADGKRNVSIKVDMSSIFSKDER